MGTRSLAQVAPNAETMALDANMFGWGEHSLMTPHVPLKQLWWTQERINAKVTRTFIINKLRGEERDFLNRPLAFGDGLTDDTYMEWILEKARRFFLILAEIGVPDQIFGCIDDSWDDGDLPISFEDVPSLDLSFDGSDSLNQTFYDTQFLYLLRELQPLSHIDYGPKEHIPMEYAGTLPPAVSLQVWDRVHFPGKPDVVYMRRKHALKDKDSGRDLRGDFKEDIEKSHLLAHAHIAPVWATYTSDDAAFIVSDFVGEHTLATFLSHRMPAQYQQVPSAERPTLWLQHLHCLADALAFLHHCGTAHNAIRPSNIIIDRENRIAFSDIGSLRTFQRGKKVNRDEIYNYAAPESGFSSLTLLESSSSLSRASSGRKWSTRSSTSTSSSSGGSIGDGGKHKDSFLTVPTTPNPPVPKTWLENAEGNSPSLPSPVQKFPAHINNFSRHLDHISWVRTEVTPSPRSSTTQLCSNPGLPQMGVIPDISPPSPQVSDVYSLGAVFLDVITFILRGKTTDFVKHRTTRVIVPSAKAKRSRNDASFHHNPDKIGYWIAIMDADSDRRVHQVYRGFPELLRLIGRMLEQDASLRPSALEVRDQLRTILVDLCGMEKLCCACRQWSMPTANDTERSGSGGHVSDSIGIAAGMSAAQWAALDLEGQKHTTGGAENVRARRSRAGSFTTIATANTEGQSRLTVSSPVVKESSWRKMFCRTSA